MARPRSSLRAAVVCAALLALVPAVAPPPAPPEEVRLELRQSRADRADRRVQVRVLNDGAAPLEVRRALLDAPHLAGPARALAGAILRFEQSLPSRRTPAGLVATVSLEVLAVPGGPRVEIEHVEDTVLLQPPREGETGWDG